MAEAERKHSVQCPHCDAQYQVSSKMLYKNATCKSCHAEFFLEPVEARSRATQPTVKQSVDHEAKSLLDLEFKQFLVLKFATQLWVLAILGSVLSAFAVLFLTEHLGDDGGGLFVRALIAIVVAILSAIFSRVTLEFIVVPFRIYEELRELNKKS